MQKLNSLNKPVMKPTTNLKDTIMLFLIVCPLYLSACVSAPPEKILEVPVYMQVPQPPQPSPEHPFLERMQSFLQGKLP